VEDWYWLEHITKNSSHYGSLSFVTTLRIHGLSSGSSSFDPCMTTHTRVSIVSKVEGNRTACRCHDIQFSEQQWNDYGIIDRIRTNKYSISPVTYWSRNKAGIWSHKLVCTLLTTFSTSFVKSIQSRPSVSFRDTCFAVHDFPISFSLFLCMLFDCVEEGTSGDVNLGVIGDEWSDDNVA